MDLRLEDVEAAAKRIARIARETPLVSFGDDEAVLLKLESLQHTSAYKLRGAVNAVECLPPEVAARGVSTVSAGNHGAALAFAARRRGIPARAYVFERAVAAKVAVIRALGAEVVPTPQARLAEMLAASDADDGRVFVSPFADPLVAAGNGTVGLEIARQAPHARTVLAPIGGGGLALGASTAIRALLPDARVWGVTAEGAPAVRHAWERGRADMATNATIADGLSAPMTTMPVVENLKKRLEGLLVVNDDQIRAAMRAIALRAKVVAEPAGAAALAAALAHPELPRPVVAIVSGGNVDPAMLASVLAA